MKRFCWVLIVAGVLILFWYTGLGRYFTLVAIQQEAHHLQNIVIQNYFLAALFYIIGYTIAIACGVPAVAPLSILGGFLFGVLPGLFFALTGAVFGSIIYSFLVRYVLINVLRDRYAQRLDQFNIQVAHYGYSYLLTLHFLTVIPFFVINTLAAFANVPLWPFIWTTVVGSFPVTLVYVLAGRELGVISSMRDVLKPNVLAVLLLLALLALAPIIIRKFRIRPEV